LSVEAFWHVRLRRTDCHLKAKYCDKTEEQTPNMVRSRAMARHSSQRNIGFPARYMQCRSPDLPSAFLVREATSRVPSRRLLADADWLALSLRDTPHRNAFRAARSPVIFQSRVLVLRAWVSSQTDAEREKCGGKRPEPRKLSLEHRTYSSFLLSTLRSVIAFGLFANAQCGNRI
jgi:hypothetical protein